MGSNRFVLARSFLFAFLRGVKSYRLKKNPKFRLFFFFCVMHYNIIKHFFLDMKIKKNKLYAAIFFSLARLLKAKIQYVQSVGNQPQTDFKA